MRLSAACVIAGLVAFVAAADDFVGGFAPCIKECLNLKNLDGCPQFNYECVCKNDKWIGDLSCCVLKKCDAEDQKNAINIASGVCVPFGVTPPPTPTCTTAITLSGTTIAPATATGGGTSTSSQGAVRTGDARALVGAAGAVGAVMVAIM